MSADRLAVAGYRIYRGPSSASDASLDLIATTDDANHYQARALYSGTDYKVGVSAIDPSGNESPMSTVTFSTPATRDRTAPLPPSRASVFTKAFSSSRIDVVWGASRSPDTSGYLVLRDGVQVSRIDLPAGLRFSDNGLATSSSHKYSIKSIDAAGNISPPTAPRDGSTLGTGAVLIARGPYLSRVTATSAVVSWWTNIDTAGAVTFRGPSGVQGRVVDPRGTTQHHDVTLTGLAPGTEYSYSVASGPVADGGTLTTAARRGTPFSFAVLGDFGGGGSGAKGSAGQIAASDVTFIQTVGDNIYPAAGLPDPDFSTTYSDFDAWFFKPFATALRSHPLFPTNGNKEYFGEGAFWRTFPMLGHHHSWYSYDWGDAHILVLDTEQPLPRGTPQYDFVQSDLATHQSAPWRIVALHETPYSSTTANSGSEPVQQNMVPLFEKYGVSLVLGGNSHNYERSIPLIHGAPDPAGITYVVSGAGGNGFNKFRAPQPESTVFREDSYYEYVQVSVSPAAIRVEAIRSDTEQCSTRPRFGCRAGARSGDDPAMPRHRDLPRDPISIRCPY